MTEACVRILLDGKTALKRAVPGGIGRALPALFLHLETLALVHSRVVLVLEVDNLSSILWSNKCQVRVSSLSRGAK